MLPRIILYHLEIGVDLVLRNWKILELVEFAACLIAVVISCFTAPSLEIVNAEAFVKEPGHYAGGGFPSS